MSEVTQQLPLPSTAPVFPYGRHVPGPEQAGVLSESKAFANVSTLADQNYATLREEIDSRLGTLTDEEKRTIQLGFGLIDAKSRSSEEIAETIGCTVDQAEQLLAGGLNKLRRPKAHRDLTSYLD